MTTETYTLTIRNAQVNTLPGDKLELVVAYQGKGEPGEIHHPLSSTDLVKLIEGCEAVAKEIFHKEFRLNTQVDMNFALNDENGLKIWHTKPNLFIKCPLTMTMNWSCAHLQQAHKTMTTLGVIELPDEIELEGNAISTKETVRVIMDSMAAGVEFMGNVMLMRSFVDHDALASQGAEHGH